MEEPWIARVQYGRLFGFLIMRKNIKWYVYVQVIIGLIAIVSTAVFNFSGQGKPVHPHAPPIVEYQFHENQAQEFKVQISHDIRIRVKYEPFIGTNGKILYVQVVELQCWNDDEFIQDYGNCRYDPIDMLAQLNQVNKVPAFHPEK